MARVEHPLDSVLYCAGRLRLAKGQTQHHGRAEDHGQRVSDALPAMSGAVPWMGSYMPNLPLPRLAEGSSPIEPVSCEASSVRMSPNMFSVTITSNWRGSRMSCIEQLSTSMWPTSTSG